MNAAENLRCFVAAAKTLNFRVAARSVALTPAAFGARIAQLEEELGAALFERTTRKVLLTERGISLLPKAESALSALADCYAESGPAQLDITLGTRHELGMSFLLPHLTDLEGVRKNLKIHIHVGSGSELVRRVRSADLDCAVGSMRVADPRIDAFPLHNEEYTFVASPVLLAKTPLRQLQDTDKHTLIDTHDDLPLYSYWRESLTDENFVRFAGIRRAGTIEAVRALALSGAGVAVLPTYYVAGHLRAKKLREVMPKVRAKPDRFRLLYRAGDPRTAIFAAMARELRRHPLQ